MRTISVIVIFLFFYAIGTASGHESSNWAVAAQCRRPGLHCNKECTALEMCVFDNGGSSSFIVEYCGEQNCHSPPGECNPQPLDSSCTFTFACQAEGQFPHPYDCTQYCTCNADLGLSCSFCDELGTAYNATSGTCDADIQQGICTDNPVPLCEVPAGIYPLEEDPSIYYVCLPDETGNLQPRFFKCLDGNEFNAETKQCSIFKCTKPGFFPDPKNCYSYYYCSPELLPEHNSCPDGEYYNSTIGRCMGGTCTSPEDPLRCTEDNVGIFPDEADCTMYYVCNPDLILSHVKCPVNTHFDIVTNVCEVGSCDDLGTTSPTPICTSPGLFPDPDDCTKYYFCTEDGIPIHQTCSSGHFDPEELKCIPGTCPTGTDPTTTPIPTTTPASFICPSPGLFPDPDDCTKYYFCMENLTPIHQTCSSGHFDPEELKCVSGTCPTGTDPTTTPIPTTTPASFICPSPGLFPDPDDCTKYYFCMENLTPIHQTCSSGYFDPDVLKCVPGSCTTGTDHTTTPIPTTTPSSFICPSPGLFPDPDDCTKYYFCMENLTPIHQTCSSGHFDPEELKCVSGTCPTGTDPTTTPIPTTTPASFICPSPGLFPDPDDCTKYYFCMENLTPIHQTCSSGYFDPDVLKCVPGSCTTGTDPTTTPIPTTTPLSFICPSPGLFPDPDDCTKYYFCMENLTPIHQTCSSGYFDPDVLKCVPGSCTTGTDPTTTPIPTTTPLSFICPSPGLFPDPDDCTKYYFCMENLTPIHQKCINGHFDADGLKCVPGPCPPDFVCTESGYFPNAQNCTTYFICFDDLTAKEESCPSGFHFDQFILICVEGPCEKSASKSTLLCTIMGFFTENVHCSG